jgi:putative intracellular protease/amidase
MNDNTNSLANPLADTRRAFLRRAAFTVGALGAAAGTSFRTGKVRAAESGENHPMPTREAVPKIGILVFEGVQIIDFAGPYEVFGEAGYDVFTIGASRSPLNTVADLTITPRYSFADAPQPDVLVTPGGNVGQSVLTDPVLEWITRISAKTQHTLSVCNGAFFLGKAGLLKGLSATTYYGAIDDFARALPDTKVVSDRRFVDNGHIITTAGLSSGIDGALHVVSKLSGRAAAQMIALNMEYDWKENSTYARASFADYPIRRIFGSRLRLDLPAPEKSKVESTQGDRNVWETRWLIDTSRTAAAMAALLGSIITERGGWKLQDSKSNGPGAATTRQWSFANSQGAQWRGTLNTSAAGSVGTVRATLAVTRA